MNSHSYTEVTKDIRVEVLPKYVPENSDPAQNYYFFSYDVKVTNLSRGPKKLMTRHWIITDGHGHVEHVRGAGVVGLQPTINAGETFSYTSFCPLTTPTGNMRGTYMLLDENEASFEVSIPLFFLRHPDTFH